MIYNNPPTIPSSWVTETWRHCKSMPAHVFWERLAKYNENNRKREVSNRRGRKYDTQWWWCNTGLVNLNWVSNKDRLIWRGEGSLNATCLPLVSGDSVSVSTPWKPQAEVTTGILGLNFYLFLLWTSEITLIWSTFYQKVTIPSPAYVAICQHRSAHKKTTEHLIYSLPVLSNKIKHTHGF